MAAAGLLVFASSAAAESRIADAVQRRDWSAVTKLLEQRIDVNAPQPDGATPLAWAAHWDALEIADRLLTAGANANLANELGVTPLMLAAVNGSSAMIERLLKAGAQPNTALAVGRNGDDAGGPRRQRRVGEAARRERWPLNSKTKTGDTALMFAAAERHPDVARELLAAGADVNARAQVGGKAGAGNAYVARQMQRRADGTQEDGQPKLLYKGQAVAVAQLPKEGDGEPPSGPRAGSRRCSMPRCPAIGNR